MGEHAHLDQRKLFKEGQKNITPPVADSTRAFYESLLKERPDSRIAIKWCIENGTLPLEEHKKVLKTFLKLKDKGVYNPGQAMKKHIEKKSEGKDAKDSKKKKEKKKKKGGKKKKKKKKKK